MKRQTIYMRRKAWQYDMLVIKHHLMTIRDLYKLKEGINVKLLVTVSDIKKLPTTNRKEPMAVLYLKDNMEAYIEAIVFPPIYERYCPQIKRAKPIVISGIVSQKGNKPALIAIAIYQPSPLIGSYFEVLI